MKRGSKFCFLATSIMVWTSCNPGPSFTGSPKRSFDQTADQVFNFTSSEIVPGTMTISDGGRYTSYDVTQSEKAPYQVLQRQNRRFSYNDQYTQGHQARFSREEFQLSEAGMLDFLLVVDDSRSMDDEQNMVATGLNALISEFKDTNWQIAVVSMSDPCVNASNLIKKSDANAAQKFSSAVIKPLDRRATEQGFPMAIQALKGQCGGAIRPWIREGSSVGVMILSDEDNCGSDAGEQDRCKNITGKNAAEMVSFLRGFRPAAEAKIYAIVDKDGTCKDAGGQGAMYVDAAVQTGGSVGSICNDFTAQNGYAEYLKTVSKDVNRLIKRQFYLSSVPDMAQFNIVVDGQPVGSDGVVSIRGNQVIIDPARFQNGMKIVFEYTHDAVPMFSELPVKVVPALESISVKVAGAELAQGTDYVYDAARRVIKFAKMPAEDSKVSVAYMDDTKLVQHFGVDLAGVRPETLKVTVNGISQDSSLFSYDNQGVDFLAPPTDGAIVAISWKTDAQKNLSYSAAHNDARKPIAWAVTDKQTGAVIPAQWSANSLTFAPEHVVEGRVVTMTWDYGEKSSTRVVTLPDERIDDDVTILADDKAGVCEIQKPEAQAAVERDKPGAVSLSKVKDDDDKDKEKDLEEIGKNHSNWKARYKGKEVALKCAAGAEYSRLTVMYKHEVARTAEFQVALPRGVDPNDPNIAWKVYIDGIAIKSYERKGAVIHIEEELLPPAVRVDVEVKVFTRIEQ